MEKRSESEFSEYLYRYT